MNIWITGCSGFLGTRLAGHLAAKQHQITGLSRRSCAAAGRSISINLASPKSPAALHQLARDSGTPDVVIHAASKQPGDGALPDFVDANVRTTSNVMEGLAQLPPALIIYTSTHSVYGRPSSLPVAETSPAGGGLPYGATKRWGEQLLETFQRYSKIVVLRLPSLYGAGQEDSFVDGLARTARSGDAIEMFSRGETIRDALHVSDVVQAIDNCTTRPPANNFSVMNLGCGQSLKTIDYARELVAALGSNSAIIPVERATSHFDLYADISAARKQIGFEPASLPDSMKTYAAELRT